MKYYIAYGSNLNIRQMALRCPGAKVYGTAILDGWELLFKGSKTGAYLTIERNPESSVPVALWEISPAHEQALDRYEGFPEFYYKRDLSVNCNGKNVRAMVYIMREERPFGVPSFGYLKTCLEGYTIFQFDESYLRTAYVKSREVCMR